MKGNQMINSKLALLGFTIDITKRQINDLQEQINALHDVVIALEDQYGELKFDSLEKELK